MGVRFEDLVETSARVASTRARREKIELLAGLLRGLAGREIEVAIAYLSGRFPQGRIGIGPAAVRQAAAAAAPARAAELSLLEVDAAIAGLAGLSGSGSSRERGRRLGELLGRATAAEQDFLVRLVHGELRQGALEGVLVDATAAAAGVPAPDLRRALMLAGDLAVVAAAALEHGAPGLGRFRLELFRPLQPMLAQPAEDLEQALESFGTPALEWKLDGARVQVHRRGEEVRVYSRGANEITAAVPELVEAARALPGDAAVLDGEVIALRADGSPWPFQDTMRRFGRRLDVERLRAELPLTPFLFDLLHLDGEDLLDRPQQERFAALAALAPALAVPHSSGADAAAAESFLNDALRRGHEGVMVKDGAAGYDAGRRGSAWLKVKLAHTLDLVVLAVERGSGRRSGWLSNLHLGARDPESGQFVMLGKTFKGMTDELLAWQTEALRALAVADDGWIVTVRPELVVEIACNEIQASSHYPAGMALRFARVKRYRPDKPASGADTLQAVRALFERGRSAGGG